ncbi:MAG TPA: helix-turn-helix domain-containing protein [Candidatus Blautia stercoravium]|nr:helix-turn-helix domain-containing protein [Candidatus Blautia stercoravium]
MFPIIDKRKTGINLRRIMDKQGITVKEIQQYVGLGSVQSVYHWLNGISMPTIDNLYALSDLFQIPIDDIVCGNRQKMAHTVYSEQYNRLHTYYEKLNEHHAA